LRERRRRADLLHRAFEIARDRTVHKRERIARLARVSDFDIDGHPNFAVAHDPLVRNKTTQIVGGYEYCLWVISFPRPILQSVAEAGVVDPAFNHVYPSPGAAADLLSRKILV